MGLSAGSTDSDHCVNIEKFGAIGVRLLNHRIGRNCHRFIENFIIS